MGTSPPGTETLQYTYTSRNEMDSVFSEAGVALRLNDEYSNKGPADYLDDVIDDATDTINLYLEWKYRPEDMAINRWVRRRCSWIACYQLAQRRGNPKQFTTRYEAIMEELERVYSGELNVPRLLWRNDRLPSHTNLTVDDRFPNPPQEISPFHRTIGWF